MRQSMAYILILVASLNSSWGVVVPPCDYGPVSANNHTITFVDAVDTAHNEVFTRTWYYTITSGGGPSISHVVFELLCPGMLIYDAGIWYTNAPGDYQHMSKAGQPEPDNFPASPKGQPPTGVHGLKFDMDFSTGQSRNYYFTVERHWEWGDMRVALKGGPDHVDGYICGPANCDPIPAYTASIGDRVWLDANGNGIQDEGEPGVPGVTVQLLSEDSEWMGETVTDQNGLYLFTNLVAGVYRVLFVLPDGYVFTQPHAGADDQVNSKADPVTGLTGLIHLPMDTTILNMDAGLIENEAGIQLTKEGVILGTDPWDECTVFGAASVFNALIFGDFTSSTGDTVGRLAVGGNADIPGGYSVAIGGEGKPGQGHPMPAFFGGLVDSFIVGGDLTDGAWGVNGNVVYGGDRIGPKRYMVNGNVVRKQTPITIDSQGNVPYDGSGLGFQEIKDLLLARSEALAAMADQGVVEKARDPWLYGDLKLTGTNEMLNVFNVDAGEWSMQSSSVIVDVPETATVLINITGGDVVITNASMTFASNSVPREQVLIHYHNIEHMNVTSFDHEGSVLAVTVTNALFGPGAIKGRAVFGGDVESLSGFEFHNFYFDGLICLEGQQPPVPPSIQYSFTIKNTGDLVLTNITVVDPHVDVVGGPIDSLAPGAVDANTFTAIKLLTEQELSIGSFVNTATAIGYAPDGAVVTASDTDERTWEWGASAPNTNVLQWVEGADFAVQYVQLVPSPAHLYGRFSVHVMVRNDGVQAGVPHSVAVWPMLDEWNNHPGSVPDAEEFDSTSLGSGESRLYEFGPFIAPGEVGTYHAVARVNRHEITEEPSFGNNFGGATYSLSELEVRMTFGPEGERILEWDSIPDYYYFVERTDNLGAPFIDIAINLPATPPVNIFVDDEPLPGPLFYRVWGYTP